MPHTHWNKWRWKHATCVKIVSVEITIPVYIRVYMYTYIIYYDNKKKLICIN